MIKGKKRQIDKHGFVKSTEFEVVHSSENSVTFITTANEQTLENYPFNFTLTITYEVAGSRLLQKITTENTGQSEMIYALGLHPGFDFSNLGYNFSDCLLNFNEDITINRPRLTDKLQWDFENTTQLETNNGILPLSDELFFGKPIVIDNLTSNNITVLAKNNSENSTGENYKKIISFKYKNFKLFGMWHADNSPILCLEPWTSHVAFLPYEKSLEENSTMCRLTAGEQHFYETQTVFY